MLVYQAKIIRIGKPILTSITYLLEWHTVVNLLRCSPVNAPFFSCDDMNKIRVGPLAMSRYHQISKIFPTDDQPQYHDQDFPHPGYLLIPSGYMQLHASNETSQYDQVYEASENDHTYPPAECSSTDRSNPACSAPTYPSDESNPIDSSSSTCSTSTGLPTEAFTTSQSESPSCSNSITFATTLTLAGASITASNTITCVGGGPVMTSETVCTIRTLTETVESRNTSSSQSSSDSEDVQQPTKSTVVGSGNSDQPSFTVDKLGRKHFQCPCTGPATVTVRLSRFYSSSIQTHANDVKPLLEVAKNQGKTIVITIVDGGPDWNTGSIVNALFFMRLWRDCNLDMLVATSFAARYSAYNPIEHLWSPLSKRLTSVRLSAVDGEDSLPPCRISGISTRETGERS